jgi:hypothetical protein
MRIGVTGGRRYANFDRIYDTLKLFNYTPMGGHTLVYGGASGADDLAHGIVSESFYWEQERFEADWERHGRAAGPIRNQQMVDSGLDLLIAFQGGRGTEDMIRRAKAAGVLVLRVEE